MLLGLFAVGTVIGAEPAPLFEQQLGGTTGFSLSISSTQGKINQKSVTLIESHADPGVEGFKRYYDYPDAIGLIDSNSPLYKAVFSSGTANPFARFYSAIYDLERKGGLKKCDFAGTGFELDNNPKTREWLISFPWLYCVKGPVNSESFFKTDKFHSWLLQRMENGRYRVLMESHDNIAINRTYLKPAQRSAYFPISSTQFMSHDFPKTVRSNPQHIRDKDNKAICGETTVHWFYSDKKHSYWPYAIHPQKGSCLLIYNEHLPVEERDETVEKLAPLRVEKTLERLKMVTGQCFNSDASKSYQLRPASCPGRVTGN
ncbi:MAG: hypothetical protein ACPGEF_08010, partial [Endozoicomonas sp.]